MSGVLKFSLNIIFGLLHVEFGIVFGLLYNMVSNNVWFIQMNSIYYSGLGLEGSLSSSFGNNSEESGGIAPVSQEIGDDSPTKILEVPFFQCKIRIF